MVRRSTWIVLGLFVVLVGFTLVFQRYQANKTKITTTATPTAAPVYLFTLGDAKVEEINIVDNAGKKIDISLDPDTSKWTIAGIPANQVDSSKVDSISSALTSLEVQETMTQTLLLPSIGLEPPAYTITLKTSAGSQLIAYVGMQTAIQTGYYVRNEAGQVMIVGKTAIDDTINLLKNPPLLPTPTPQKTPTEVSSLTTPEAPATTTP